MKPVKDIGWCQEPRQYWFLAHLSPQGEAMPDLTDAELRKIKSNAKLFSDLRLPAGYDGYKYFVEQAIPCLLTAYRQLQAERKQLHDYWQACHAHEVDLLQERDRLRAALEKLIIWQDGTPCYRTRGGRPQEVPTDVQQVLRGLEAKKEGRNERRR